MTRICIAGSFCNHLAGHSNHLHLQTFVASHPVSKYVSLPRKPRKHVWETCLAYVRKKILRTIHFGVSPIMETPDRQIGQQEVTHSSAAKRNQHHSKAHGSTVLISFGNPTWHWEILHKYVLLVRVHWKTIYIYAYMSNGFIMTNKLHACMYVCMDVRMHVHIVEMCVYIYI